MNESLLNVTAKPTRRPERPQFSSGPCVKRPGWSIDALKGALVGRSHRAPACKQAMIDVAELSREVAKIPDDYLIGILAGSDTGAFETAMWNLLGAGPVDGLVFDFFSGDWGEDLENALKLPDCNLIKAPIPGQAIDLSQVRGDADVVLAWNGTSTGMCIPHTDWLRSDRNGLVLCDATSAIFSVDLPWNRMDAITWSWQKAMGGEAQHGMIALSPRAVKRLETYQPSWPIPKMMSLTKGGKFNHGIFAGNVLNTTSLIAVEDALDSLRWAKSIGGLPALKKRNSDNAACVQTWVDQTPAVEHLVSDTAWRSPVNVCFNLTKAALKGRDAGPCIKMILDLLEREGVGFDLTAYPRAPAGFRIYCGPTMEKTDLEDLLPWLDYAIADVLA